MEEINKGASATENFISGVIEYENEFSLLRAICETESVDTFKDPLEDVPKRMIIVAEGLLKKTQSYLENKGHLNDWESTLQELCNDALSGVSIQESDALTGTKTALLFGIGKLINLGSFLYEKYYLSAGENAVMNDLERAGLLLMPDYQNSILYDVIQMVATYVQEDEKVIAQTVADMVEAAAQAQALRSDTPNFDRQTAELMLEFADYAYRGLPELCPFAAPLSRKELPYPICNSDLYKISSGLLNIPGSMKVLFCRWNNKIIIGFAGTEVLKKIPTLGADIQQLLAPNLMYLRAVGIVSIFAEAYPDTQIIVTGHSLGGGLAQTAVLANAAAPNILGCAFNAAGLSKNTLDQAGNNGRLDAASLKITHYCATLDPVSAFGALVGAVEIIENATFPYHCISNIKGHF